MLRNVAPILSAALVFGTIEAAQALEVSKRVTVNAPAEEVWDEINDFDDLDEHPAVAEAEIIKGGWSPARGDRSSPRAVRG